MRHIHTHIVTHRGREREARLQHPPLMVINESHVSKRDPRPSVILTDDLIAHTLTHTHSHSSESYPLGIAKKSNMYTDSPNVCERAET